MLTLLAVLAVIAVLSLVALALSLRIVQQYEEGVLFRPTVVFPAPLMSTIQELGAFLAREQAAATTVPGGTDKRNPSGPLRESTAIRSHAR